jgi:dCMP deaminase
MKSQLSWDRFYLDIAEKCAQLSYDPKTKVGCVIVKNGNIISFSYNGTPTQTSNATRDSGMETLPGVIHAEMGAIGKLVRHGGDVFMSHLYCTRCPCIDCAKLIYSVGVHRVVYRDEHSCSDGKTFLRSVGIQCMKID